ncbi:hypothetical protein ILYODFUR_024641, partial [Ilyodon furcidens]
LYTEADTAPGLPQTAPEETLERTLLHKLKPRIPQPLASDLTASTYWRFTHSCS